MILNSKNPKIKLLCRLAKDKLFRKKQNLFFVEETYLLPYLKKFSLREVFYNRDLLSKRRLSILENVRERAKCTELSENIFRKLVVRKNPEGILFLLDSRVPQVKEEYFSKQSSFVAVLSGAEKPGNVGAIMRTMLALMADALIITSDSFDLYSPNLIRAARGANFSLPTFLMSNEDAKLLLEKNSYRISCTQISEGNSLFNHQYNRKEAIVFGSEAFGLSKQWLNQAQSSISIPMDSIIDSLNLSISLALCLYEYRKQYPMKNC